MTAPEARALLEAQRAYFRGGATLDVAVRKAALKKLYAALGRHEEALLAALHADLGKSASEARMCEVGLLRHEISYMLRHLRGFAGTRRVRTPLSNFPARSFELRAPYGTVLIMSPWNYPLLLTLGPLIDALAAGNTAIVKPSAYAPASAAAVTALLEDCFPPEWVAVVNGGRAENAFLLELDFDYIFFTGSQTVGREVLRKAAEHLTPVTLELGGKSPCIVDASADIALAARRIVFGKLINSGQTCVAPDHVLCDARVKEEFLLAVRREIARQYGEKPLENPSYGKMVNQKHFDRVRGLIAPEKVVCGGEVDASTRRIAPTVLDNVTFQDAVMGEEIFGPLLPVVSYTDFDAMLAEQQARPSPLALYVFSRDRAHIRAALSRLSFGGGCVNDTIVHLATVHMGFGGVGASGMGAYHGRRGFETFTHTKSIVRRGAHPDVPLRYAPYSALKDRWIGKFLK